MKLPHIALLITASACLFISQSASAFTATTLPASANTPNTVGGPGADVGDTFSVPNGTFAAYLPGAGDPQINGGDLNKYHFTLSGTVTAVNNGIVTYKGSYTIFYDTDNSNSLNAGDYNLSSGSLSLTVNFTTAGPVYAASGSLHQTSGAPAPFTSFANPNATLTGTYTPVTAAQGFIQGTIQSAPDTGSTLALLGLATLGVFALQRRIHA